MTVEVCTVWAPRRLHEKWDPIYEQLLPLQAKTARRFGAKHSIITDDPHFRGSGAILCELPRSLMKAMIAGVIRRLDMPVLDDIVFADIDVLVGRNVEPAFAARNFDLGLTRRFNPDGIKVNNGAMYVERDGAMRAKTFFCRALEVCGDHWGADQEAISRVASPVPDVEQIEHRGDLRIAFLSMLTHNVIPKTEGFPHRSNPYMVHFKGATKHWAQTYAHKFLLGDYGIGRLDNVDGRRAAD